MDLIYSPSYFCFSSDDIYRATFHILYLANSEDTVNCIATLNKNTIFLTLAFTYQWSLSKLFITQSIDTSFFNQVTDKNKENMVILIQRAAQLTSTWNCLLKFLKLLPPPQSKTLSFNFPGRQEQQESMLNYAYIYTSFSYLKSIKLKQFAN